MKTKIARGLLWFAVIWWAVWFGGQLFNALMVVPHFSANPPQSLVQWGQMRFDNLADFFAIFNSLWILIALIISLILRRKTYNSVRLWVAASAIAALLSLVFLMWMVPTISRLVSPDNGSLSQPEIISNLHAWITANWIRLFIEFCGFVFAVRALSVSNNEAANNPSTV